MTVMFFLFWVWNVLIILNIIISYFLFIKEEKYFTIDDVFKFFIVFIVLAPIGFIIQLIVLYEQFLKNKRFRNPLFRNIKDDKEIN